MFKYIKHIICLAILFLLPNSYADILNIEDIHGSTYSITQSTSADYAFKVKALNNQGEVVEEYYKINIAPSSLAGNIHATITETNQAESNFTIELPNNQKQYFKYNFSDGDYNHAYGSTQWSNLPDDGHRAL